jgi:hypothetical protein
MKGKKRQHNISVGRCISVCLMIFCLAFLTSLNFFIYSGGKDIQTAQVNSSDTEDPANDYPPSGPTEEKSSSGGPITISEEILHESHPEFDFRASNQIYLHHIAEAENVEMFHPDGLLRPPQA